MDSHLCTLSNGVKCRQVSIDGGHVAQVGCHTEIEITNRTIYRKTKVYYTKHTLTLRVCWSREYIFGGLT